MSLHVENYTYPAFLIVNPTCEAKIPCSITLSSGQNTPKTSPQLKTGEFEAMNTFRALGIMPDDSKTCQLKCDCQTQPQPVITFRPSRTCLHCCTVQIHIFHTKILATLIFTAHNPFVLHNESVDKTGQGSGKEVVVSSILNHVPSPFFQPNLSPFRCFFSLSTNQTDRPSPNKPRGKPLPFLFPLTTTNAQPLPRSLSCPAPSPRVYRTHNIRSSRKDCYPLKSFPAGSNPTPFTQ